jgi:rubrerythrin
MTVAYPRKLHNKMSARDILKRVVGDRQIHLITLNRYRYNEQRSCKDLTNLIETLNGKPKELVQDLSHHVADEARHAFWLTDLLVELGADIDTPPGMSYINEFERLIDEPQNIENAIIEAIAAINVTEKRGCEYFSAHIQALKEAPETEENLKIRTTIENIFPEEAGHVRWGNRWLAKIAAESPEKKAKVEAAKRKYVAIEHAAYECGMDILAGAELRRLNNLLEITKTMPIWEQTSYFMEKLPQTLFDPQLQLTRIDAAQRAWARSPQDFLDKFVPMFFQGIK